MKKIISLLLVLVMVFALAACGGEGETNTSNSSNPPATGDNTDSSQPASPAPSDETISLRLWGAEEDQAYLADRVEAFKAAYPDQKFDIQIGVESESTAKDTILTDVESAADVYHFASDQLPDLVNAGAILELSQIEPVLQQYAGKSLDDVKAANLPASIEAASYQGNLYAFPFASDGWFMFYDPDYITDEQAGNWTTLLDAAQAAGKKVGFTMASGWYNAAFFYGAGFSTSLNADGTTAMDWNGTSPAGYTGVQVVKAMQAIAGHPAFLAVADGDLSNQIASGSLAAVFSGTWDTSAVSDYFGEDYKAGALPTVTLGNDKVRCSGVVSFKCIGVNPHSAQTGWAVLLAEFLSNEESQIARFEARQIGPTNINASASEAVQANKGIAGLADAAQYGTIQAVGGNYWDPVASFGEQIAQGTIGSDDASIQTALDQLVAGVTAPIS